MLPAVDKRLVFCYCTAIWRWLPSRDRFLVIRLMLDLERRQLAWFPHAGKRSKPWEYMNQPLKLEFPGNRHKRRCGKLELKPLKERI